jgi:hypothetical protein
MALLAQDSSQRENIDDLMSTAVTDPILAMTFMFSSTVLWILFDE